MLNARLFGFWNGLTDALRTGSAQNESKGDGKSIFSALYADEARLEQFLSAMASLQIGNFVTLANRFDFSKHKTVLDVGGASAQLSRALAARHPHLSLMSFDLPAVSPIARREISLAGLVSRIEVVSGDFFVDALPAADVIVMGNILHDWNEEGKRKLIAKAYAALLPGGALIAIENVIDDARRQNAFGLLMSLNMLIEFGADGGFDYTGAQYEDWCLEAGFSRTECDRRPGPRSHSVSATELEAAFSTTFFRRVTAFGFADGFFARDGTWRGAVCHSASIQVFVDEGLGVLGIGDGAPVLVPAPGSPFRDPGRLNRSVMEIGGGPAAPVAVLFPPDAGLSRSSWLARVSGSRSNGGRVVLLKEVSLSCPHLTRFGQRGCSTPAMP